MLPAEGGILAGYQMAGAAPPWPEPPGPPRTRVAYTAAHVVASPLADPAAPSAALDWDATMRVRARMWSRHLRVAEAMDTSQRNMGLDWPAARELIARSAEAARDFGDPAEIIACGAGTDHAPEAGTIAEVGAAYAEQVSAIEAEGAGVILMASRELARVARGPEDYHEVYGTLLRQVRRPVILHWLGEMFDPLLAGYWGHQDAGKAAGSLLDLIRDHADKVNGVKISLLDESAEISLREALPDGVRMYTGDDFNYVPLIESGSDALLGVFDAIAPAAAAALQALDAGEVAAYRGIFEPTVPLARKIFEAPTYNYKTGLVFLAWLSGYQDAFVMVRGAQSARSLPHLAEVFRLADTAGLLPDPDLAASRMTGLLATYGIAG